jgi:uncharacterized protein YqhQ
MKTLRWWRATSRVTECPERSKRFSFRFLASAHTPLWALSALENDAVDEFDESGAPPAPEQLPELQLGGQALIEGVMMRSPRFVAAAVRRADGQIQTRVERFESIIKRRRVLGWPFLRGIVGLFEMMLLGTRYLNWSSSLALEDAPPDHQKAPQSTLKRPQSTLDVAEERIGAGATAGFNPLPLEASQSDTQSAEAKAAMPIWAFAGTAALSLLMGFALFVALPNIVTDWLVSPHTQNKLALNGVEGALKLLIFIGYLWGVGKMPNIRRVFEYHGAEHKVVFAAENHRPLTPEGARPFDTPHPRCGTGFALLTVFVSVFCFVWLPWTASHLPRVAMRLALMPVIAGVSYEILKLTANPRWKGVAIAIMTPGLWLQRLTTRQPDDAQLEVSCAAMRAVIAAENGA